MSRAQLQHSYLDRLWRQSLVAAVVGGGLCALGAATNRDQFFQSYLTAFVFWWSIAVGSLAVAMLHQLVRGTWGAVTAGLFESAAATLPITALLFVPILLGMEHLYPWAGPGSAGLIHGGLKANYLTAEGFGGRTVAYFALWIGFAWVLGRWSSAQHGVPADGGGRKLARLSAGGLVVLTLTVTFAAVDWMMSLEPDWYSTIYGAIIAVGAVLSGLAFVVAVLARISDRSVAGAPARTDADNASVFNDLGNLLLAFLMLWAYMAFSQFLIIWSGDQPQESVWYARRLQNGWQWFALAVLVLEFAVPFLLLLSRDVKRYPKRLAMLACGLLCMRYIDLHWTIAPAFDDSKAAMDGMHWSWTLPRIHWLDLVSPVAVGGIWMAVFVRQLKKRPVLPPIGPGREEQVAEDASGDISEEASPEQGVDSDG